MPKQTKVKQKVQAKKKGAPTEKIERNIKDAELKPEIEKAIIKEIPKMSSVTPYQVASKYNVRLSVAKKILAALSKQGLIKLVATNNRIKLYTQIVTE